MSDVGEDSHPVRDPGTRVHCGALVLSPERGPVWGKETIPLSGSVVEGPVLEPLTPTPLPPLAPDPHLRGFRDLNLLSLPSPRSPRYRSRDLDYGRVLPSPSGLTPQTYRVL